MNEGDGERMCSNDGSLELIPVFHNPHRNGQLSPSAVAFALVYLVGVPSKTASSERNIIDVSDGTDVPRHSGGLCLAVWVNADACLYA